MVEVYFEPCDAWERVEERYVWYVVFVEICNEAVVDGGLSLHESSFLTNRSWLISQVLWIHEKRLACDCGHAAHCQQLRGLCDFFPIVAHMQTHVRVNESW